MKTTLLFIVLLISNIIFSQVEKTKSFSIVNEVKILDEQIFYRNYFSEYQLSENWIFRSGLEERSINNLLNSYTLIELPFLFKYSLNTKFSVLLGPKIDVLKSDSEASGVSLFSTFGLQYNLTEGFSIDAKVNYNLSNGNTTSTNYLGSDYMIYRLGTKLIF